MNIIRNANLKMSTSNSQFKWNFTTFYVSYTFISGTSDVLPDDVVLCEPWDSACDVGM